MSLLSLVIFDVKLCSLYCGCILSNVCNTVRTLNLCTKIVLVPYGYMGSHRQYISLVKQWCGSYVSCLFFSVFSFFFLYYSRVGPLCPGSAQVISEVGTQVTYLLLYGLDFIHKNLLAESILFNFHFQRLGLPEEITILLYCLPFINN